MTKEIRMTKIRTRKAGGSRRISSFDAGTVLVSDFELRHSFVIRHSSFVISPRHSSFVISAGFTLMEVMLALAVSAIVLAGIGGVFYSALRLRERTVAILDQSLPLNQAFAALRRDLHGALPPASGFALAGDFKIELQGAGLGRNFRLQCSTSTGLINGTAPGGDIQDISYELRDPLEGGKAAGKDLVRSINRNPLGSVIINPEEQTLIRTNVQSLEFAGYDGSDWRESWDTSLGNTNLPSAVRVRIQLAAEPGIDNRNQQPFEMIVPLVSQSRTNQTTTTGGAQ